MWGSVASGLFRTWRAGSLGTRKSIGRIYPRVLKSWPQRASAAHTKFCKTVVWSSGYHFDTPCIDSGIRELLGEVNLSHKINLEHSYTLCLSWDIPCQSIG